MSRPLRVSVTFLVGAALFVLVPLAAWGFASVRAFAAERARLAYLGAALGLNAFAAWRIPEIGRARPRAATTVRRQHAVVVLLQVLSIAIVAAGPYTDARALAPLGGPALLRWLGLVMYVKGFLLMHLAEAALGRQFSVEVAIQPEHALVTGGVYRHLRHPRYLGIIVFGAGIALVFDSLVALGCAAAVVPLLLWRIADEEALMRREFGPAWEAYRRRTWRLVPFVF